MSTTSRRNTDVNLSFRNFSVSSNRRDSDENQHDIKEPSASTRRRRVALKCGRARRKSLKSMQREESLSLAETSMQNSSEDNDATRKNNSDQEVPKAEEKKDGSIKIFGAPMGNPIRERYIRSLKPVNYPSTLSGWKTVFQKTWKTYLWTFEGFILEEKKRDADGNIIPQDEEENDENASNEEEGKSFKDKATEAATEAASNLQKNVSTLKEEAPKLLQMGQEITGVSSKAELREWVSDQLKLATACVSEFMKGYRKGRDEEIDRMLHEYFKDLDEKTEADEEVAKEDLDHEVAKFKDTNHLLRQKRPWGRRERRRSKALHEKARTPVEIVTTDLKE